MSSFYMYIYLGFRPKCQKLVIQLPVEEEPKLKEKKVTAKKNAEENNDGVPGEAKKKKSTKFSKPNINVDLDLFSQLPDLNLDYNSAPSTSLTLNATSSKKNIDDSKKQKKATSKTKKSENTTTNPNEIQLKLFQDCNFLNVTRKTLTRTNTGTLVISKPPNIKNLTKFFVIFFISLSF